MHDYPSHARLLSTVGQLHSSPFGIYLDNRLCRFVVYAGDLFIQSITCMAWYHRLPHIESWTESHGILFRLRFISTTAFVACERNLFIGSIIRVAWYHKLPHIENLAAGIWIYLVLVLIISTTTRNCFIAPANAWFVVIGCRISIAGKPHGSFYFFWNILILAPASSLMKDLLGPLFAWLIVTCYQPCWDVHLNFDNLPSNLRMENSLIDRSFLWLIATGCLKTSAKKPVFVMPTSALSLKNWVYLFS